MWVDSDFWASGRPGVPMLSHSCICVFCFLSCWPGVAGVPHVYSIFSLRLEGRNHQERCNCSKTGWANEDGAGKPYQSASHICHLNCPTLQNWIRNKTQAVPFYQKLTTLIKFRPSSVDKLTNTKARRCNSIIHKTITHPLTDWPTGRGITGYRVQGGPGYRGIKLILHLKRWHNLTF